MRVACAFSCQAEFLQKIDKRARSLGLSRSGYITQVLRQDLLSGSPNLSVVAQPEAETELKPSTGRKKRKNV